MEQEQKQQINLYLPEFRPRRDWLNATRLLQGMGVVLLLMAVLSAWDHWRESRLVAEHEALQEELANLTRETETLERRIVERDDNAALLREAENREQQLARSRELLEFLRTMGVGNIEGFSEAMKDLSRASFPGLWLTGIRLREGGDSVYLEGLARRSAMVPDYVGRLSRGASELRGRQFNRVLGNRRAEEPGQENLYEFVLETR